MTAMWFTGPAEDPFRYRVTDPAPLPGGQGFVFAASTANGTSVALKLREDAPLDVEDSLRQRLDAVSRCRPASVAEPLEVFRGPGLFEGTDAPPPEDCDLLYVAMRWAAGQSLRAAAPLSPKRCATMATCLAAGLTQLHERCGLVHRDVHPGNIILDADGQATLIDLGATRPDDGTATVTVAGAVGFIAPERTHGPGDARTDAWGLGMVTAFALLGHPLAGMSADELEVALTQQLADRDAARRVARLLMTVTAADPDARPTDLTAWAAQMEATLTATGGRRPRARALAVAALATSIALGATTAVVLDRDSESAASATSTTQPPTTEAPACTADLGAADEGLRPDQLTVIEAAVATFAERAPGGCGTGAAGVFGEAAFQPLRWHGTEGDHSGIVVVSPLATVVLTPAQWASYREIAGRSQPENAITFGGYPLGFRKPPAVGGTAIELSMGGLLIGARADTQAFWMPRPVLALWEEHGGAKGDLGLPMTNPYVAADGLRQDFAGGYLRLPPEVNVPLTSIGPEDLELHLEPNPLSLLPAIDLRGGIVSQPTSSAWWIDHSGVRHWIADGTTYDCMGGAGALRAENLPGAALATIALGAPATCEDR